MYNPKFHKAKLDPSIDQKATTPWVVMQRQRGANISNLILGTVNAAGFSRQPNYLGGIMQPFALLGNDRTEPEPRDPKQWQPSLPGTGLTYLVSMVRFKDHENIQDKTWGELLKKLKVYMAHGVQTLYSPSSLPVDCIDGSDPDDDLPISLGAFLGFCRRQLSLREHLDLHVDWTIPLTSYEIPAWEAHSVPVTPTAEAFEDLVLPAIGEYIALMLMMPTILKGGSDQMDAEIYRNTMAGSVLANLKSFDLVTTKMSGYGEDLPDLTEFKEKLRFAESYVNAVAEELVAKAEEPGNMQAINTSNIALIRNYIAAVDAYGRSLDYKPYNRGRTAEGVERHQGDTWKCNQHFIESKVERTPTRKRYINYFQVINDIRFNRISSYAFERSYPESFVHEILKDLPWDHWRGKEGRTSKLGHGVWETLVAKSAELI